MIRWCSQIRKSRREIAFQRHGRHIHSDEETVCIATHFESLAGRDIDEVGESAFHTDQRGSPKYTRTILLHMATPQRKKLSRESRWLRSDCVLDTRRNPRDVPKPVCCIGQQCTVRTNGHSSRYDVHLWYHKTVPLHNPFCNPL